MGIKGRRVHIIEEMSSCVISFQRGKTCFRKYLCIANNHTKSASLKIIECSLIINLTVLNVRVLKVKMQVAYANKIKFYCFTPNS